MTKHSLASRRKAGEARGEGVATIDYNDNTQYVYRYIFHSPSQPRGMTKQYAHNTRAQALSLPTGGGGTDLQS